MKLVAAPFVRIIVSSAEFSKTMEALTKLFNAKVDFQFDDPPSHTRVYSVSSDIGSFSLVESFIDVNEQVDFVKQTKATYSVQGVDEIIAQAKAIGLEIPQNKNPVATGTQTRIKISEGAYFEIVEWSEDGLKSINK